jgi:hypothetical protein
MLEAAMSKTLKHTLPLKGNDMQALQVVKMVCCFSVDDFPQQRTGVGIKP